ncbi:hypothetical protein CEXT_628881 [Caerostris extrusa]|uniref:Uncharacterized protein n=1 Tax=Caerostris extrusa TaxID=172846 RepID=A0AAV4NE90_CAEEX|nr:hypothetical protein CEXT_628881 [Caerostris extrusa]
MEPLGILKFFSFTTCCRHFRPFPRTGSWNPEANRFAALSTCGGCLLWAGIRGEHGTRILNGCEIGVGMRDWTDYPRSRRCAMRSGFVGLCWRKHRVEEPEPEPDRGWTKPVFKNNGIPLCISLPIPKHQISFAPWREKGESTGVGQQGWLFGKGFVHLPAKSCSINLRLAGPSVGAT